MKYLYFFFYFLTKTVMFFSYSIDKCNLLWRLRDSYLNGDLGAIVSHQFRLNSARNSIRKSLGGPDSLIATLFTITDNSVFLKSSTASTVGFLIAPLKNWKLCNTRNRTIQPSESFLSFSPIWSFSVI